MDDLWADLGQGEAELLAALESFHWQRVKLLAGALAKRVIREPGVAAPAFAFRQLRALRRKRRFPEMACLADAFLHAGMGDHQIRRQYAQSLIDQGLYYAAEQVLRGLLADTSTPPGEQQEAYGLLGRTFKQRYVDAGAPKNPADAAHLRAALQAYWVPYSQDPRAHYWHGINIAALLVRAAKDGVEAPSPAAPEVIAAQILENLEHEDLDPGERKPFELGTALEASLALADEARVRRYLLLYSNHAGADAFEIGSTLRQMVEVWQLDETQGFGRTILPNLRAALLKRAGGALELATDVARTDLQKVFGADKSVSLDWYLGGLKAAESIARIEMAGKGLGTGWLVRASQFFANQPEGRLLLLTNAHVVGPDSPDRYPAAIYPEDATVNFQIKRHKTKVKALEFHSRVSECDATFLELESLPDGAAPLVLHETAMRMETPPQRLYIIGHPAGRDVEFSLQDNFLLGLNERLIHYRTPSERGSSGSPVFAPADWKVVALHHAGSTAMKRIDGQAGVYEANEGIAIGALRGKTRRP